MGCPSGGVLFGVFDTQLATVVDGGALVIPKACCRLSLLDNRPMSLRKLQFTGEGYPAR